VCVCAAAVRLGNIVSGEFTERQQQQPRRVMMERVSDIDHDAEQASRSTRRLYLSVYALLGWVSVVTVAVAAVAVVTLRRRRRRASLPVDVSVAIETERGGSGGVSEWTRSLVSVEELPIAPRRSSSSSSSSSSRVISLNE